MGTNREYSRESVTEHTMISVHRKGPVFYASTPCADRTLNGSGSSRSGNRNLLVSTLWEHLVSMKSSPWKRCQSSMLQVVSGPLGRPHLLVGEQRGPAISFSEGGGKIWAALCGSDSGIGIDAAGTDEFQKDYPVHRVFHPEELHHALRLAGGDQGEASALLWSVKEAVVKALGCAFHLVDPRHVNVYPAVERRDGGYTFPVGLSGKALERFPLITHRSLRVHSLPQGKVWFSIALVNRTAVHE
jgi:4'-phosphopantetheinyl transferase superfamily